jgi:hypothetical protein
MGIARDVSHSITHITKLTKVLGRIDWSIDKYSFYIMTISLLNVTTVLLLSVTTMSLLLYHDTITP